VPSVRGRSRRQRCFYIFLRKFFAEGFWQLLLAKLGTPELEKFFPELPSVVAKSTRQRALCRRPLSAKRPYFVLFIFLISTLTNIYIYIYIVFCYSAPGCILYRECTHLCCN
jgi:hypothetical protein